MVQVLERTGSRARPDDAENGGPRAIVLGVGRNGIPSSDLLRETLALAGPRDGAVALVSFGRGTASVPDPCSALVREVGISPPVRIRWDDDGSAAVDAARRCDLALVAGRPPSAWTSPVPAGPVFEVLQERYRTGSLLLASTAGAAAYLGEVTPADVPRGSSPPRAEPPLSGLGMLAGIVVQGAAGDSQIGQLMSAATAAPGCIGLRLEEHTGVQIQRGRVLVFGDGSALVVDPRGEGDARSGSEDPAWQSANVLLLPPGHGFDIEAGRPLERDGI